MKRAAWWVGIAVGLASGTLQANGRYPLANQLVVSPGDPTHIAVRATFGLVVSADGGTTWSWICEKAAGFVNGEDPPIEITGNNAIVVTSSSSFTVSRDFGCSWSNPSDSDLVVDADVDRGMPNRTVALTSLFVDAGYSFGLLESADQGATWNPLGAPSSGYALSVALAPSPADRIYVSAGSLSTNAPIVSRSDDHGQTWKTFALPDTDSPLPFIAAVDPTNGDRVYVRGSTSTPGDVLLVSEDGGASWKEILKTKGSLLGFALSPDGKTIAIGGPGDALSTASVADYQFKPVNDIRVTCLAWTSAGIFACADQALTGFGVGLSTNRGQSFEPLFQTAKLALRQCDATTETGKLCEAPWQGLTDFLKIDAGARDANDAGGDDAFRADAGGDTVASPDVVSTTLALPPVADQGGSGCSVCATSNGWSWRAWAGIAMLITSVAYGRASRIKLNGVCVARRKRVNPPPVATTSLKCDSPACAPSAGPRFASECGTQSIVEAE
jgi:hypothetical protein